MEAVGSGKKKDENDSTDMTHMGAVFEKIIDHNSEATSS